MAQTNFTAISTYFSSTPGNVPSAGNLVPGELAINIADGILYYKNAGGAVTPYTAGASGGTVTSVGLSGGSTGLTVSNSPITTSGTMFISGVLNVANGGTGSTTSTGTAASPVVLADSPVLTGTPTAPTQVTGNNTTAIATTAFVQAAVSGAGPTSVVGLGFGGTSWNNVTGSRALGATYTNSRAYPIMVSATVEQSGANATSSAILTVAGVIVAYQSLYVGNGVGANKFSNAVGIVPPGQAYSVTGQGTLTNWAELY